MRTIFTDQEIIDEIVRLKPAIVAIDAPLTTKDSDRKADLEMKKYGAISLNLPGMQMLAERGYNLSEKIKKTGTKVIEVFTKASEKIMGLEKNSLSKSSDQADAIIACLTASLYLENKTKEVGDGEGKIIIRKPLTAQNEF